MLPRNERELTTKHTKDTKNLLERCGATVCHTIVTWQLSRFSL